MSNIFPYLFGVYYKIKMYSKISILKDILHAKNTLLKIEVPMSKKKIVALGLDEKEKFIQAMAKYILRKKKEQERLQNLRKFVLIATIVGV